MSEFWLDNNSPSPPPRGAGFQNIWLSTLQHVRWWDGATNDTAKTWWLYLGVISLVVGCIYFLVAMGGSK